ncbi:magnesium-dependent phosphatase-1 [Coprinopsis marcescibilis]|uniref:Magnesium-dependent phosphatase-1 n=1 Tax=Coprinopsis marcescibilis TaxID=230819 RepID=A0A5C3KN94_COPMA|nr:magnesium-dependent phosphatase-1 [Coprinopsis marcescibilis]
MAETARFPKLIAFDLDYTLWDLWIDTHVTGPLRRHKDTLNQVLDRDDQPISFYRDIPAIFHRIRGVQLADSPKERPFIAACSRTHAPDLAYRCLNLLLVPPPAAPDGGGSEDSSSFSRVTPAINFFDQLEIYPGSKIKHFKKNYENTGIDYADMLFFDDEIGNKEVEKLGVVFCHVPAGVNNQKFEQGLAAWRKRSATNND